MGNTQRKDALSSSSISTVDIWEIPSLAKKRPRMPPFKTSKGSEGASSSTSCSGVEKGLSNPPGQNNCFLNVVIQALWHIEAFRETLMYKPHEHPEGSSPKELENCIYNLCFSRTTSHHPMMTHRFHLKSFDVHCLHCTNVIKDFKLAQWTMLRNFWKYY